MTTFAVKESTNLKMITLQKKTLKISYSCSEKEKET